MSFLRKAAGFVARRLAAFAEWEAGRIGGNRDRGYLPGFVQDAVEDLDQASRDEMVRKSRYWEKNDGICNRCADIWEQYTVGSRGLVHTPASSSPEFNAVAADAWSRWSQFPDLSSRMDLASVQSLTSYRWFWDGEISILKTRGSTGRPRIQLIECQRIATPHDAVGDDIHDGVQVDANGRPITYFIQNSFRGDVFAPRPAEAVIRIFEPSRVGQLRGFPILAPVLNDVHDLDDLEKLEMRAAKDAARRVWGVKRKGASAGDISALRRERLNLTGQTSTGTATTESRDTYFRKVLGGETAYMEPEEEMELFASTRPSDAVREHWDHVISKICAGAGIPRLLVLPKSMQGTVTRADLDAAAAFFRSRSAVLIKAFTEVYIYVIGAELRTNVKLASLAPPDWFLVNVRPPKGANVDVGRNSSAMIAELEAGTLTYESVMGDAGEDWRAYLRQRAEERRFIRDLATEFDLDPQEIAGLKAVADAQKVEQQSKMLADAAPVA